MRSRRNKSSLAATAELILTDLINIASNGVLAQGAGSLIINLQNDSTTFMSGSSIEFDLQTAESEEDTEVSLTSFASCSKKLMRMTGQKTY